MKINNKILKAVCAIFLVLAAALAFFRFDLLNGNKAVDNLGLYTDKSAGNLFGALVFILIGLTVLFAFLIRKNSFGIKKHSALHSVSAALCMLLLLSAGISSAHTIIGAPSTVLSAYGQTVTKGLDVLHIIETVLIFVSVAYFLFEVIKTAKPVNEGKFSILALIPVIYLAIRTIRLFMNIETQINSSARSFTLLFLVVTMMYFICEAEWSVPLGSLEKTEEENSLRTAKCIGFGLVCAELAIIFVLAPMFAVKTDISSFMFGLSDLSLALFATVRVFAVKIENK